MIKAITNKCIILDLDETCIHSYNDVDTLNKLELLTNPKYYDIRSRLYTIKLKDVNCPGDGSKIVMWGIMRPYLKEFLYFCFSYFEVVAVWSAGVKKYVRAIVDHIFKDIGEPHIVFSREKCHKEIDNNLTKPITKMIKEVETLNKYMSLMNTFIVDDRLDTFKYNFTNGILIPPYEPAETIDGLRAEDYALPRFMTWLSNSMIQSSSDIRTTNKDTIFSIPLSDIEYINIINNNPNNIIDILTNYLKQKITLESYTFSNKIPIYAP